MHAAACSWLCTRLQGVGGYLQVHPYIPKPGSWGSTALQKALDWMLKIK